MRKLLRVARAHVGVTLAAATVVLGGAGAATAVVVSPTSSDGEVFEVAPDEETTAPATTTAVPPPAVVEEPAPVDAPVVEVPAATVEDVTPTRSGPSLPPGHRLPDLAPGQDPEGAGSIGPDGNYTPAPPIQHAGDAPLGPDANARPPAAEPLPGEPGYVPPGG